MSALIDGFWLALFGPFFFAPMLMRRLRRVEAK